MTTRLAKVSTKALRERGIKALCPSCRGVRRCLSVGAGVVDGQRREILRCMSPDCELEFLPRRRHLTAAA